MSFCYRVASPLLTDTASPLQSIYSNRNPVVCDPSSLISKHQGRALACRFDTTCLWRMRTLSPALSLSGVALVQKRGAAFISSTNAFNRSWRNPLKSTVLTKDRSQGHLVCGLSLWSLAVQKPHTRNTERILDFCEAKTASWELLVLVKCLNSSG